MNLCRLQGKKRRCRNDEKEPLGSYQEIVDAYIRNWRDEAREERRFFQDLPPYEAIRYAALCMRPDGKRHSHQCRIPVASLAEAEQRLQTCAGELQRYTTFGTLHAFVRSKINDIYKVKKTTVYDITTRIGAHLGIEPDRVYLHAGVEAGAKELGFHGRSTLAPSELPCEFQVLRPYEMEDCLCIYKDALAKLNSRRQRELLPQP
jgi:hypothetical protein